MADRSIEDVLSLARAGQLSSAEKLCLESLERAESAPVWLALGSVRARMGRLGSALQAFERAVALDPANLEARLARGSALAEAGRGPEALAELEAARALAPRNAGVLAGLGTLRENLGETQAALALYDEAIALDPESVAARLNRGALRLRHGRAQEALKDFDAIAGTGVAAAHVNRARALFALQRDGEALAAAQAALALAPEDPLGWYNKALAHCALGDLDAGASAFARSKRADPGLYRQLAADPTFGGWTDLDPDPATLSAARALQKQAVCDWSARGRAMREVRDLPRLPNAAALARHHYAFVFDSLALGFTAAEQHELARHAARAFPARAWDGRSAPRSERVRVAFLSPDFRDHPMAWLGGPLLAGLDRARFEVFAYALNPDAGDPQRKRLLGLADRCVDFSRWTDEEAAGRIRADEIEVLIECGGYCEGARPGILARRPAPVQASYLGVPGTLGAPFIDYRLSDAGCTPPEAQPQWSERLALLPETHLAYEPPGEIPPAASREQLGLPSDGFVFCCMSNPLKIEPAAFGAWMRILRGVPRSVLWLHAESEVTRANLRREADRLGIEAARLVFARRIARPAFVANLANAGLFLDTFHFGAHTTALDALWAGVPVLTRPGETMASRLASSLLLAARLPELIARDTEAYVEAAVRLALSDSERGKLRARVAAARNGAPVFARAERVAAVGRALSEMSRRHRADLAPGMLILE